MRQLILFAIILTAFSGCDRDTEEDLIGVVSQQGGCLSDSYLVQIVGGNTSDMSIFCPNGAALSVTPNCSNAVFISLPEPFRREGTRIRFIHTGKLPSCLSSSFAPSLITVKSLRFD